MEWERSRLGKSGSEGSKDKPAGGWVEGDIGQVESDGRVESDG